MEAWKTRAMRKKRLGFGRSADETQSSGENESMCRRISHVVVVLALG